MDTIYDTSEVCIKTIESIVANHNSYKEPMRSFYAEYPFNLFMNHERLWKLTYINDPVSQTIRNLI